jgi:hypothetical protein
MVQAAHFGLRAVAKLGRLAPNWASRLIESRRKFCAAFSATDRDSSVNTPSADSLACGYE